MCIVCLESNSPSGFPVDRVLPAVLTDLLDSAFFSIKDAVHSVFADDILYLPSAEVELGREGACILGADAGNLRLPDPAARPDVRLVETYLEEEADMAKLYSHLTAKMAAELAREAQVGKLYLTHISRRYREKDILAETQPIFPNTEIARDLSQFQVKHIE